MILWAGENGFACIDADPWAEEAKQAIDFGIAVGMVALTQYAEMLSIDIAAWEAVVEQNQRFICQASDVGSREKLFVVPLRRDPLFERRGNLDFMVNICWKLMPVFPDHDTRIVMEGWPGRGALCGSPETRRAFFPDGNFCFCGRF